MARPSGRSQQDWRVALGCVAEVRGRRAARRLCATGRHAHGAHADLPRGGEGSDCRPRCKHAGVRGALPGWAARLQPAVGALSCQALSRNHSGKLRLRRQAASCREHCRPAASAPPGPQLYPRVARPTRRGGPRPRCGPAASAGCCKGVAGWGGRRSVRSRCNGQPSLRRLPHRRRRGRARSALARLPFGQSHRPARPAGAAAGAAPTRGRRVRGRAGSSRC